MWHWVPAWVCWPACWDWWRLGAGGRVGVVAADAGRAGGRGDACGPSQFVGQHCPDNGGFGACASSARQRAVAHGGVDGAGGAVGGLAGQLLCGALDDGVLRWCVAGYC